MRIAKVMLGLSGLLLMSMVLVSFQAAAHPGNSAAGHAYAPCAPVGSNIADQGFANGFGNPNSNAFDAIANNPLCPLHGECTPP